MSRGGPPASPNASVRAEWAGGTCAAGIRSRSWSQPAATSGTAQLNDQYGNLHEVPCRLKSGDGEVQSLPPGTPIILLDYDREKKLFYVRVDPLENTLGDNANNRALP